MRVPDGFLSNGVAAGMGVVALLAVGYALQGR